MLRRSTPLAHFRPTAALLGGKTAAFKPQEVVNYPPYALWTGRGLKTMFTSFFVMWLIFIEYNGLFSGTREFLWWYLEWCTRPNIVQGPKGAILSEYTPASGRSTWG